MHPSSYLVEPASPRPLYLQLADDLRRQIENGTLKPGDQVMPELALAQHHSVARGTVRQALQLLVSQGLLRRKRRMGTFVAGRGLAAPAALITLVIPYLRDALVRDIMLGVESILRLNGCSLVVGPSHGSLSGEAEHLQRLPRHHTGGLILFPVALPGELELLKQALPPGFPIVLIDRKVPGLEASSVLVDNYGGAYRAVNHLLALGHRRIACVSHDGTISSVAERVRGYEQALRDAGLEPLPLTILPWRDPLPDGQPPDYSVQDMAPVGRLLRASPAPTALFCINDFFALGTLRYILRSGRRIPEDVAIVGFDDIPLAALTPVPLTTVAQPKFEIGSRAALLLLDHISGKETAPRSVVLPTALVVRASSAAS
jgi:GntR family transcriptional regulator of arabinose operon